MDPTRTLTLIAPRVARDLSRARSEASDRWPELARLAGRGAVSSTLESSAGLEAWQIALLEALGLADAAAHYPQAALMSIGEGCEPTQDVWLLGAPMHLVAGLNTLSAALLEDEQEATPAERAELMTTLRPYLDSAGFELLSTASGPWLLHARRPIEVTTATPAAVALDGFDGAMPTGRDAAALKRLMTELQMLLHAHPINEDRARRALPAVNALWLHSAGALGPASGRVLPCACGDDAYLRGLYRLHGQSPGARASDANAALAGAQQSVVALLAVSELDELERRWLAPASRALRSGAIMRLVLALGRWRVSIDRNVMMKFWRGARAPAQWLVG